MTFEGWFASEEDFQGQLGRGLVECPMCGDTAITKMLSAPRLNSVRCQAAHGPSKSGRHVAHRPHAAGRLAQDGA
jgi:hypothetical protein